MNGQNTGRKKDLQFQPGILSTKSIGCGYVWDELLLRRRVKISAMPYYSSGAIPLTCLGWKG